MNRRICLLAGTTLLATAVPASAQAPAAADTSSTTQTYNFAEQDAKNSSIFSFDYGVPVSPALTLAGLATAKITPANTLKPFVLSLPSFFDSASSQNSVALDVSPGWILGSAPTVGGNDGDLRNQDVYQASGNWLSRMFYRSRLGAALYRGDDGGGVASKAKPSQLAFGYSTSLLDSSDPLLAKAYGGSGSAWIACLNSPKEAAALTVATLTLAVRSAQHDTDLLDGLRMTQARFDGLLEAEKTSLLAKALAIEQDPAVPSPLSEDAAKRAAEPFATRVVDDIKDFTAKETALLVPISGNAAAMAAINDCKKQASDAAQHGADLQIGFGAVMSGDAGHLTNLQAPKFAGWIAGRLPLRFGKAGPDAIDNCGKNDHRAFGARLVSCWEIGGMAHYATLESIATGNTATPAINARVEDGWVGLERIDADMKLSGYVGYTGQKAITASQSSLTGSGIRWLASADFSLAAISDGLWIEGSYGSANGAVSTLDDKTFMLSLSFGPPAIGSGFVTKSN